jgi:hypothetical protein
MTTHNNADESVVYLGLNRESRKQEAEVFKNKKNATILTGSGDDETMQGKVPSQDPTKGPIDLRQPEGVIQFLTETGVGNIRQDAKGESIETEKEAQARIQHLAKIFVGYTDDQGQQHPGLDVNMRDEMAGLVQTLQNVQQGKQTMDRLVISGHSTGSRVFGPDGGVSFQQFGSLMSEFPKAQGGVQDLMLSACHTLEKQANTQGGEQYKQMLPNVQSVWGYNGKSPRLDQGSPAHMRDWLGASQGNNPEKLKAAAKKHSGQSAKVLTGKQIGNGIPNANK